MWLTAAKRVRWSAGNKGACRTDRSIIPRPIPDLLASISS